MTPPVFADASAGAKRYLDEPGAEIVRETDDVVVASLSRVEVASAIWRKERDGPLSTDQAGALLVVFENDWYGTVSKEPAFAVIDATTDVLALAALLLGRHGLRTGDAIQLASALTARQADPEITGFLCFDQRLRAAARSEGFALLPAEL